MVCKLKSGRLAYGMAVGALALTPLVAQAQDTPSTMGSMTSSTTMSSGTMMQPTALTGTVLRYYVDRSGFVSAADIQTANGVQMVRFAPSMAQRLYSTYPVGGQVSLFVTGSPGSSYVVGMGETMPAAGFMSPYMVTDIDLLKAEPYILAGTRMAQFTGKLRRVVTDQTGEVLGMILDGVQLQNAVPTMASTGESAGNMMGGMTGSVLVRVPREMRHSNTMGQVGGSMRVAPLFPGAQVEVVGYPEAPRFGVLSPFGHRVSASALVLNGRAIGALGIPKMSMKTTSTLINSNIGSNMSAEERSAIGMGYSTYDPTGTMGGGTGTQGSGAGTSGADGTTGGM